MHIYRETDFTSPESTPEPQDLMLKNGNTMTETLRWLVIIYMSKNKISKFRGQ